MSECINHTCKDCIHFKICNDYEYLIGREGKVACPDFKSTEDVVPRSEVVEMLNEIEDNFEPGYGGVFEFKRLLAKLKKKYIKEKGE